MVSTDSSSRLELMTARRRLFCRRHLRLTTQDRPGYTFPGLRLPAFNESQNKGILPFGKHVLEHPRDSHFLRESRCQQLHLEPCGPWDGARPPRSVKRQRLLVICRALGTINVPHCPSTLMEPRCLQPRAQPTLWGDFRDSGNPPRYRAWVMGAEQAHKPVTTR